MAGGRFALVIASFDYSDKGLRRLTAPPQDAASLARVLGNPEIGAFTVQTIINEQTHRTTRLIETFFSDRARDDLLLLYFSGHGIKDQNGKLFFAMSDTERSLLSATAIPANFVNDVMQQSQSHRHILLLDCCYSGAFVRGMVAKSDKGVHAAQQLSARGRIVLTASDAMQYAFEGDDIVGLRPEPRSIFTHHLVEGIESGQADLDGDGEITLDELYDYVYSQVSLERPEQSPGKWVWDAHGRIVIAKTRSTRDAPSLPTPFSQTITRQLESRLEEDQLDAVEDMALLLNARSPDLAHAAAEALERLASASDGRVAAAAGERLAGFDPTHQPALVDKAFAPAPPSTATIGIDEKTLGEQHSEAMDGPTRRVSAGVRGGGIPLVRFSVQPELKGELRPLLSLASNLRWSWDSWTQELFRRIDSHAWETVDQDPFKLLVAGLLERDRLDALSRDEGFLALLQSVFHRLTGELSGERWFQSRPNPVSQLAYFSAEFGVVESLPQYSGSLGIHAGEFLKSASDLGVPVVGVGLLYQQGYFRQQIGPDGWQQERYLTFDPHSSVLERSDVMVSVEMSDRLVHASVWKATVGRSVILLLDTDIAENDEVSRQVADRLYGGDGEHRFQQELLLGIGGLRAISDMGFTPQLLHLNEGHTSFAALELIRLHVSQSDLSFGEAVEAVRNRTVFTLHGVLPTLADRFPRQLVERYLGGWAEECGTTVDELMRLGQAPGDPLDHPLNMSVLGIRLAGRVNGTSALHGDVSRMVFGPLWPGIPVDDVPISSITSGVHAVGWVSTEMHDVFDRHVLPGWQHAGSERWSRIQDADDQELWRARQAARSRLVAFVRRQLRESLLIAGLSSLEAEWTQAVLDPSALTIGMAHGVVPHKRLDLLLSMRDRLAGLLGSSARPVQILIAGTAHPADDRSKEIIQRLVQYSRQPDVRTRFVFVQDYSVRVAKMLCQGCDVWLNLSRRPLDACATSGQKAVLNGALYCATNDGWWDEYYDGQNGWTVPSVEGWLDTDVKDHREGSQLFDLLEREVVPLFYLRQQGDIPHQWLERVRASLRSLGPRVSGSRMVREYVEEVYEPTVVRAELMSADAFARTRGLVTWKGRVAKWWPGVRFESIEHSGDIAVGRECVVHARVSLGALGPDDIGIQLLHGRLGIDGFLYEALIVPMRRKDTAELGATWTYEGRFVCEQIGPYGFSVRAHPSHPDLLAFSELGLQTYATGPTATYLA